MAPADFGTRGRLKVAAQGACRGWPDRGTRGKAINYRHVRENSAHAIPVAFTVALIQNARQMLGIRLRMSRAHKAAHDLGCGAVGCFRVQGIATEEIDFL